MTETLPPLEDLAALVARTNQADALATARRDLAILRWADAGRTIPVIAQNSGLSTQRIGQILRRQRAQRAANQS